MITYLAVYLVLVGLSALKFDKTNTRIYFYSALFFLLIFAGTRFEVGCDYDDYERFIKYSEFYYNTQVGDTFALQREPAFFALVSLIANLGGGILSLNLVVSLIFFVGLAIFAARVPNPLAMIALLFPILIVGLVMSGLRQAAACGFVLMAFASFLDGRRIAFIAFILIGALFHNSALLFAPAALMIGHGFSYIRLAISALAGLPFLLLLAGERVDIYRERYLESDISADGAIYRSIVIAMPAIIALFARKNINKLPVNYRTFVWLSTIFCLILVPVTLLNSVAGERFGQYLTIMSATIAVFVSSMAKPKNILAYAVPGLLALYFVYQVFWHSMSHHADRCYTPYQSFIWM